MRIRYASARPRAAPHWRLGRIGCALAGLLLIGGSAFAQSPLSEIPDPPEPGQPSGDAPGWEFVRLNIPGLAPGASLGAVFVPGVAQARFGLNGRVLPNSVIPDPGLPGDNAPGGGPGAGPALDLYVWALHHSPPVGGGGYGAVPDPDLPGDPGDGGADVVHSTLYHYDGVTWTVALDLANEVGHTIFAPASDDVFAVTVGGNRPHMYHYDGIAWREQPLPIVGTADAGAIDGRTGDLFFRADKYILHYNGFDWTVAARSEELGNGGALVYIEPDEVYAIGPRGHLRWEGANWRWAASPALGEVNHAWGTRDAGGTLQLYAAGSWNDSHMRVWKFREDVAGTMVGNWGTVTGEPFGEPGAGSGDGLAIWGTPGPRVYAIGTHEATGCLFRFAAGSWEQLWGPHRWPAPNDVVTDHNGGLWVTLANGQLVNGRQLPTAGNNPPDCSAAVASPSCVLPPHRRFVPIAIHGVVDPDGDPVTIRVMEITQDEPVTGSCPDALIAADRGSASVRAERDGHGNGRVYRISFEATDAAGAVSGGAVTVCVPRGKHATCGDDGQRYVSTAACAHDAIADPIAITVTPRGGALNQFDVSIADAADVLLVVYDVAGRRIATIENARWSAGAHAVTWDASGVPAGLYFCRFTADGASVTRPVLVRR